MNWELGIKGLWNRLIRLLIVCKDINKPYPENNDRNSRKHRNSTFKIHSSKFIKSSGFVLIELLVAVMLFSVAGTGLYSSFIQSLQAKDRIQNNFSFYDPIKKTFFRLEKDFSNIVYLAEYPFEGKADEVKFPVLFHELDEKGSQIMNLYLVRYYLKRGNLIRSQRDLMKKDKEQSRLWLEGLQELKFIYPYKDIEESVSFESFWLEEPYVGLPRALAIEFKIKSDEEIIALEKNISIPHGKWGYLPSQGNPKL